MLRSATRPRCQRVRAPVPPDPESAKACAALIDTLCAKSATIKAAVVSADMFLAMAKPATAGVALKLIETYDIPIDDKLSGRLLDEKSARDFTFAECDTIVVIADPVAERRKLLAHDDGWQGERG